MEPWKLFEYIKHSEYVTSGDDVQWAIRVSDDERIIRLVFQESASRRDWVNNLNFPVKPYKKQESCLLAARGWGDAWKSCNDEVMAALIEASEKNAGYDVHICGWSYGGAMSVLAAEDFHYRTGMKASVYTFGAPKPLFGRKCKKYVLSCVNEVRQYAHINDCVPLCPPLLGYKRLSTDKVGRGFSLINLFKPSIYHQIYGEEDIYAEVQHDGL